MLRQLELGNSVAEFDEELDRYFVETEAFRRLKQDKADIISGDKGTGKTALYRVFTRREASISSLHGAKIVEGFNPAGNPVFQKLGHSPELSEAQYITVWKTYFVSLVGNWLLEQCEDNQTPLMRRLHSQERCIRKVARGGFVNLGHVNARRASKSYGTKRT